jgi:phage terminase large subunit-like protein
MAKTKKTVPVLARVDPSSIDIERLTPGEQQQLEALWADQVEAEPLGEFIQRVTPRYPPPRHVQPIIEQFEAARLRSAEGGDPIRVCISMPPRHAKSETVFNGLAWWMAHVPADTHAYLSYSVQQARSQSRKIRRRAVDAGVALDRKMANLDEWRTSSGGGLFASGVDGPLTGKGITGLAVIDDPFKGRSDADSATMRETVWDWFTSVVMSRLEDASVMIVHTRWHEDDLIGRLSRDPRWTIINLPALAEVDDPLQRDPGAALWPAMYPVDVLLEQRALDAFNFDALYQGRPRPRGATVFKEPTYYDPDAFDLTGWRLVLYADPAASKKTTANHSSILALAVKGYGLQMEGRVIDVYRKQETIPQFVRDLMAFQARHGHTVANVESVAGFKAVAQMLRDIDPQVLVNEVTPLGDKFQRAQPAASAWNGDPGDPAAVPPRPPVPPRLLVPLRAPWLKDFLAEVKAFTGVNDAADDQVDCLSGAWNEAANAISFQAPRGPILPRRR